MEYRLPEKPKNTAASNFTLSIVVHTVAIVLLLFVAAREGILGNRLKTLAVSIAPKPKPEEKPKEHPKEPEPEPPKPEDPVKPPEAQPVQPARQTSPPPTPSALAPPAVAPPAASVPALVFHDGAKAVQTSSDPIQLYRGSIESLLRSRWRKPEGIDDTSFTAEIELSVDPQGNVVGNNWKKRSGNSKWDTSVQSVLALTKSVGRPPPKGFPDRFLVRFDVQMETTEEVR